MGKCYEWGLAIPLYSLFSHAMDTFPSVHTLGVSPMDLFSLRAALLSRLLLSTAKD